MKFMTITRKTYEQAMHTCAPVDAAPRVELELMDGGGGYYLVLHAEHMAFDTPEEVDALAAEMKAMLAEGNP